MAKFNSRNIWLEDEYQVQLGGTTASPDAVIEMDLGTTGNWLFDIASGATTSAIQLGESKATVIQLGGTQTASLRFGTAGQAITSFSTATDLGGASSSDSAVATQLAVKTYVDNRVNGLDWQESVKDIVDNTAAPPTEVSGDRYLLDDTAGGVHADWDGASVNDIVEFNGTTWDVVYDASADEGGTVWVEDVDLIYSWDGSNWTATGSFTASTFIGLTDTPSSFNANRIFFTNSAGNAVVDDAAFTFDTTGNILSVGASADAGQLRVYGSTSGYVGIDAPAAAGTSVWTLPVTGTAGVLYTDAAGNMAVEAQLSASRGGTGLDASSASNGQLLIGNGSGFTLATLTGTANEVSVANGAGSITLSLPNDIYLGSVGSAGSVRIYGSNASGGYVVFAADSANANVTYTWPTSVTASYFLQTDGSGNLSWQTISGTIADGTSANNTLRWDGSAWVESSVLTNDGTDIAISGDLDVNGTLTAGSGNTQITDSTGNLQQTYNFTENNVLTDDATVYASLQALDLKWGDLASTSNGEGASLIGVEDADGHWSSTTVEGVLDEIGDELLDSDGSINKHGRQSVSNSATTQAVTFTTAYSDTNYTIEYTLTNTTDASPSQYGMVVTSKATTGFTVTFSGAIDSANYVLEWVTKHD